MSHLIWIYDVWKTNYFYFWDFYKELSILSHLKKFCIILKTLLKPTFHPNLKLPWLSEALLFGGGNCSHFIFPCLRGPPVSILNLFA